MFCKQYYGLTASAVIVATVVVAISLIALWKLEETFRKDLDYTEHSNEKIVLPETGA